MVETKSHKKFGTITCSSVAVGVAHVIDKNCIMSCPTSSYKPDHCLIGFNYTSMAVHIRPVLPRSLAVRSCPTLSPIAQSIRCFSVLNRPPPNYEGHIPLTRTERLGLAIGSGLGSFLDPRRGGTYYTMLYWIWVSDTTRSHRVFRRSYRAAILHL